MSIETNVLKGTLMFVALFCLAGCSNEDKEYERYLAKKRIQETEELYLAQDEASLPYEERMLRVKARQRMMDQEQKLSAVEERKKNDKRNTAATIAGIGLAGVGTAALVSSMR